MTEIQKIHLSNDVTSLIPDKQRLHYMYEDGDVEGSDEAKAYANWLERYNPGAFILIETGDLITPDCVKGASSLEHWNGCEYYDADYYLYLVPASVWKECSETVLEADKKWREGKNQCQLAKSAKKS